VAARVTRHVHTVDVAGIVFQLSCSYPKPGFWARRQPAFISRRRPDVRVRIEYDEGFVRRTAHTVGETVADAATVRRHGGGLRVSTGYYRANVDISRGRVAVRMAPGFDVAGLMRTLSALWLAERGALLVRAACFGPADFATLACGLPGRAMPSPAATGWFAVAPGEGGVEVRPTPFLDHAPGSIRACRATTLWLPGSTDEPAIGAVPALRALFPWIWQTDRRRGAVERTLDLAARSVTALVCRRIDVTNGRANPASLEAMVG
jgi:hypothetical protein